MLLRWRQFFLPEICCLEEVKCSLEREKCSGNTVKKFPIRVLNSQSIFEQTWNFPSSFPSHSFFLSWTLLAVNPAFASCSDYCLSKPTLMVLIWCRWPNRYLFYIITWMLGFEEADKSTHTRPWWWQMHLSTQNWGWVCVFPAKPTC